MDMIFRKRAPSHFRSHAGPGRCPAGLLSAWHIWFRIVFRSKSVRFTMEISSDRTVQSRRHSMQVKASELLARIREMFPEIEKNGVQTSCYFEEKTEAWVVDFTHGDHSLKPIWTRRMSRTVWPGKNACTWACRSGDSWKAIASKMTSARPASKNSLSSVFLRSGRDS